MALVRRVPCIVHKQVTVSATTTCDLTLSKHEANRYTTLTLVYLGGRQILSHAMSWKVQENLKMFPSKLARHSKSNRILSHLLSYELSNILPYPENFCFRFQSPFQAFRDSHGKLTFFSTFSRLQPYPSSPSSLCSVTSESF